MRTGAIMLAVLFGGSLAAVQQPTADQIIRRIDQNQVYTTQSFRAKMIIEKGRRRLVKEFYGWGQGRGDKSFMEFINPEDRGVRYLKLGDEMWIYFPDADDILKISGHMLRQGMMGSDISYEDMMETEHLEKLYTYTRLDDETVNGHDCWVVDLKARDGKAVYARQVLYVHKTYYLPVKIDMYARGGRLIKTMTQEKFVNRGGRYMALRALIKDKRRRDSQTLIEFTTLKFNTGVPPGVFTRGYLKK